MQKYTERLLKIWLIPNDETIAKVTPNDIDILFQDTIEDILLSQKQRVSATYEMTLSRPTWHF